MGLNLGDFHHIVGGQGSQVTCCSLGRARSHTTRSPPSHLSSLHSCRTRPRHRLLPGVIFLDGSLDEEEKDILDIQERTTALQPWVTQGAQYPVDQN